MKTILTQIIASAYILLWLFAGVTKLADHESFYLQLQRAPYISWAAMGISWVLPLVMLGLAVILANGKTRFIGLGLSVVLLGLISVYIVMVLLFSDSIPCTCGGLRKNLNWNDHIKLNSAFLIAGLLVLWYRKRSIIKTHSKVLQDEESGEAENLSTE